MIQKNISCYDCTVQYNNQTFYSCGNEFLRQFERLRMPKTIIKVPFNAIDIYKFEETENELILHKGKLIFNISENEGEEEAEFIESFESSIRFDKKTKEAVQGFDFKKEFKQYDTDSYSLRNIATFLNKVILFKNRYVFEELRKDSSFLVRNIYSHDTYKNLFTLIIENTDGFEKILKINKRFLEENIGKSGFEIGNEGDLNKVIQLPQFAMKYMKDLKLEKCYDIFKEIANKFNGNTLRILLDFYYNMKLFLGAKNRYEVYYFSQNVLKLLDKNYKITDLLGYLLKQSVFFGQNTGFKFPFDEIKMLVDYVDMCEKYGLKYEKFPQFLRKAHNVVMKNINAFENAKKNENEFKKAVGDYKWMEYRNKKYSIITPENISDLIQEGNFLHHCVGSYSDKIIARQSRILFLRKKDSPSVPYITIEISPELDLLEAKGMYNKEADGEDLLFIKEWLKSLKKKEVVK